MRFKPQLPGYTTLVPVDPQTTKTLHLLPSRPQAPKVKVLFFTIRFPKPYISLELVIRHPKPPPRVQKRDARILSLQQSVTVAEEKPGSECSLVFTWRFMGSYNYKYLNLPNPTFLSVLIINPNMEFIGTRQKSRFWWVKVGL